MKIAVQISILILVVIIIGCEKGGCYYTCCISETDCLTHCTENSKSAEECAVYAQDQCANADEGYIQRVEWSTVSGVFCTDCAAAACAPSWWTAADELLDETVDTMTNVLDENDSNSEATENAPQSTSSVATPTSETESFGEYATGVPSPTPRNGIPSNAAPNQPIK